MPFECLEGWPSHIECEKCGYGELTGWFEIEKTDEKNRDYYIVKFCPICGKEI